MSRVATIQEQLLQVDDLIAQLERDAIAVPKPKPSLIMNIRALEKERRNLQTAFDVAVDMRTSFSGGVEGHAPVTPEDVGA